MGFHPIDSGSNPLGDDSGKWWNWHTRQTQNLLPKGLRVQVSPCRIRNTLVLWFSPHGKVHEKVEVGDLEVKMSIPTQFLSIVCNLEKQT